MLAISPTKVETGPEVFINFRGAELRTNFVSHLHAELKLQGINAFIDTDMDAGEKLENLFRRIEESRVALAILSSRYTESRWCLDELVRIKECVDRCTLCVIPILYKLKPATVKKLEGDFGDKLWNLWRQHRGDTIIKWDAALQDVAARSLVILEEHRVSNDRNFKVLLSTPPKKKEKKMLAISPTKVETGPEVFINFRGAELRTNFVSHLHAELKLQGINAFIDTDMDAGEKLENLFRRIEESRVALAILSSRYTESRWCLDELVRIKECVDRCTLCVIPILYKLKPATVKKLEGDFGDKLWNLWRQHRGDTIIKWDAALQDVAARSLVILEEHSIEHPFVLGIVEKVKIALTRELTQKVKIALTRELTQREENPELEGENSDAKEGVNPNRTEPGEQRLKQLGEKLDVDCNDNETRVVAVVGMGGIGKTFLAKKLLEKLKKKIGSHMFIESVRETSKAHGFDKLKLQKTLVEGLLPNEDINCDNENPLEVWKDHLLKKKVAVVLDDVNGKEQVNALLGNCDWIKKGSRIIITTRDKSFLKGMEMVSDIYEVPGFNDSESLELFSSYAFDDKSCKFMELSRKFVDYTGGNPLALKALGKELLGKDKGHWEARLVTMTKRSNEKIRKQLISYDELNEHQKDVFLDIACFFRSQDENYIKTLLHCSFDAESGEAGKEVRELSDKFLIRISEGRVEMDDLIYTLGRELAISCVETTAGKYRLLPSNREEFIDALKNKEERDKIRGIFLDMSKMEEIPLDYKAFVGMNNLRYLKVYNSHCPRQCEADSKLNLPDGLEFPICNVRYFHWLKFPAEELPCDLDPKNLIDLRLPYSHIRRVWTDNKATPKLKWVDLSYSSKLSSLLGLSKAPNLLRLNLEGCTSLEELSGEILQNMKNLIFLNLRGCTDLVSLPEISLCSLKILILSGCSKFQKFQVISENLETLYLNGTAIDRLPPSVGNLQRLILLDLKDCTNLETLSDCTNLGNMRCLQELKLSGCSKLKSFPKNIENLRNLLLEGTAITEMPQNINGMSLLRRLCLSRNDEIYSLQFNINELYHLKWLELMYCKNLKTISGLPPNLQCLYAHGCTSLKTVSSPLALLMSMEQIHSTFIFTNCHELEQVSKNDIMSCIQNTRHPTSYDQYNRGFVIKSLISTCFPGSDVPQWFKHQAFGSVLKQELPRHWDEGKVNGLALCVVVSFNDYKDQNNGLQVKCTFEFTDHANVSLSQISFFVGGWTKIPEDELSKIDSDHVFLGYNNWFYIKCEEDRHKNGCVPTNVSLRFEVTDGASKVKECKVMKCGFSLIYESEGTEKVSRDTTFDANSMIEESKLSETKSYKTAEDDADFCGEGAQGLETWSLIS